MFLFNFQGRKEEEEEKEKKLDVRVDTGTEQWGCSFVPARSFSRTSVNVLYRSLYLRLDVFFLTFFFFFFGVELEGDYQTRGS